MKTIFVTLILMLSAFVHADTWSATPVQLMPVDLWNYTCEYADTFYGVSCAGLSRPTVITSKVVNWKYYGFRYNGETLLYISQLLTPMQWRITVVHESMHYIMDFAKSGMNRCESEEAARRVHHSYEGTAYTDDWRSSYNCSKP